MNADKSKWVIGVDPCSSAAKLTSLTRVYWLEQTAADVPDGNEWLGAGEAARLDGLRFAKRRADWRLGRWTAKRALSVYLNVRALAEIEIRAAACGAPEVFLADKPAAVTISLSHSSGIAACAVAESSVALGCDLETIEPRSDAFIADYFTAEEQRLVARASPADRPRLLTLLWSGKESVLKLLREGLRLDTRSVSIDPAAIEYQGEDWCPLQAGYTGGRVFQGWWRSADNRMRTLVSTPPPDTPVRLRNPC